MRNVNLIKQIISTDDARVAEYEISAEAIGARHRHSNVFEQLYCLSGQLRVQIADQQDTILKPGESVIVPPGKMHCTSNLSATTSRFMVIQGGGQFDIERD